MTTPLHSLAALWQAAGDCGINIVEDVPLPRRDAVTTPVPIRLHKTLRRQLEQEFPAGLYKHQTMAIDALLDGKDVALSTSTASGKSLVFITGSLHLLLTDPTAKILTFYPAKALIQDQIEKWRAASTLSGMRVGFINGDVPVQRRSELLESNRIILMTPDVAHAWLMSNLRRPEIARFLNSVRLVVLDEAHVYEGVFGTNMAYFLRRLDVMTPPHQVLCSTATLRQPSDFVYQLTGRTTVSIDYTQDGAATPERHVLLASDPGFEGIVNLLRRLATVTGGRFLGFSDSRKMVEQIVAATFRAPTLAGASADNHVMESSDEFLEECTEAEQNVIDNVEQRILPFRAGYEVEDARDVQLALCRGKLGGVVSTSAMELGLDIGEIDLVVLLNVPPSRKAFWQRVGRAGRRRSGICLVIDTKGTLTNSPGLLREYMKRDLESSWLYLENRYLQYANVLCAAQEISEAGTNTQARLGFQTLPQGFRHLLENELNPSETVPPDLYPLKQRALGGPHREFPLRSGIEKDFRVSTPQGVSLGNVNFSQVLHEAYPGAIYYYMARPYRVVRLQMREGYLSVRNTKYWTTRPISTTMVFPQFRGGILSVYGDERGFLTETQLQVSERVVGFQERRGGARPEAHRYGPSSPYYPRDLTRFFESTGVCWYFADRSLTSEEVGARLMQAFSAEFGIQERDLGVGIFHSNHSPFGEGKCTGLCIYDAVNGSLRLTQTLAERFADVTRVAGEFARAEGSSTVAQTLGVLHSLVSELRATLVYGSASDAPTSTQWTPVIAPGDKAIYMTQDGAIEVRVITHLFTPKGLMYSLQPERSSGKWIVTANALQAIHGTTRIAYVDLMTGEICEDVPEQTADTYC